MPNCLGCQEEISTGQFVTVPGGPVHPECFICPVCGKSLLNEKGYLPFKGNYLCGVNCRVKAVKDPSLLLQTSKHWRETNKQRSGWEREDGIGGYEGGRENKGDKIEPRLAAEAATRAINRTKDSES